MTERTLENRVAGATTTTPPPTPASARIPPEIWLEIFEYATNFVPHLQDIDIPHPFAEPTPTPFTDYHDLDAVRLSVRTKHALALVCRAWHAIAIDLLHHVVLLDSTDTCRILSHTLLNTHSTSSGSDIGPSVRHLLLGTLDRRACRYLPTILRTLTHLRSLSLWNATAALSDERTADALVDRARTLRRLHVYGEKLSGQPLVTLYDLVHAAPRLRTLVVDCKEIQGAVVLPPMPELAFVSGHNLILDTASLARSSSSSSSPSSPSSSSYAAPATAAAAAVTHADSDPFPRLTHTFFPARRLFSRVHSRAYDALSAHATTTATVDLRRDWEVGPEHDLWAGLAPLWTRCPNVLCVQLVVAWQQFAATDRFPPQLGTCPFVLPPRATHLAILATFTGTFRMGVFVPCLESLLESLERAGRMHHALRVVRFVSPVHVARVRQAAREVEFGFVKALHDRCAKLFRLEDHEGRPLLPAPAHALVHA